jgi:hypothetical protein
MLKGTVCLVVAFFLIGATGMGAEAALTGTWEGTANDLPAVELTIRNADGRISGVIGFYFQSRSGDGRWHVGEKTSLPLLLPKLNGRILTFETTHRKKHDSPELGPNNRYRVAFIDANEARLNILKDGPQQKNDLDSGLKLILRK